MKNPSYALLLAAACATAPTPTPTPTPSPAPSTKTVPPMTETPQTPRAASLLAGTAAQFEATCTDGLAAAQKHIAALKAKPAGGSDEVLRLYDEAMTLLDNLGIRSGLAKEVHPDEKFRQAAEECEQKVQALGLQWAQDRTVYDALQAAESPSLDPVTALWLRRTLREFRRSGVDRDEPTRQKVAALNEELVKIGQSFTRNIRDDVRTVKATPAELAGLPADFLAAHPAAADGTVAITTNTPDYQPVMLYGRNAAMREKLWRSYRQRAFPANEAVLGQLIAKRHELATLLGYASWAAYATETKMAKTPEAVAAFIERGRQSTERRAKADMATLLERKRKDVRGAKTVEPWDVDYYDDRVKAETFGFDSQALRAYFEFGRVKQGVMDISARLFGVRYQKVTDAKTWHPDVETYDLYEGDTLLGRLHLDLHPRAGKYKHAAQFGLTTGRAGKELPEGALVCNFPPEGELMQHSDVETFFHEFGHLLHSLFAGRQKWDGVSGINTEWDFVEVPSMLLQEWPLDAAVLGVFARHYQTQEVIPASVVAQMKRAREFGVGLQQRRQFFLSAVSFQFYARPPGFNTNALLRELQGSFEPFRREWVEGTHFELGFGHLEGYSAAYYTYQWSTVIAKDLLTRFEGHMLDGTVATPYRKQVLDPGGSREAGALVESFLGRPTDFKAYQAWLDAR